MLPGTPQRATHDYNRFGTSSLYAALGVRYDKKARNYVGLIQLACALPWYRRLYVNNCVARARWR